MHGEGVLTVRLTDNSHRKLSGEFCRHFPKKGSLSTETEFFKEVVFDGKSTIDQNPVWYWTPRTAYLLPPTSLSPASQEYEMVISTMKSTKSSFITSIERVTASCRSLFDTQYLILKRNVEKVRNLKWDPDTMEKWAFFAPGLQGSSSFYGGGDPCISITLDGFSSSLCGFSRENIYGAGIYFASKADQALHWAIRVAKSSGQNESLTILMCRILPGQYTQGHRGYAMPPFMNSKDNQSRYDSMVDNVENPNVYVIPENTRAYSAYIIKFSSVLKDNACKQVQVSSWDGHLNSQHYASVDGVSFDSEEKDSEDATQDWRAFLNDSNEDLLTLNGTTNGAKRAKFNDF